MSLIRGQKSIGMVTAAAPVATLPSAAENPQAIIEYLLARVADLETLVEGKADSARLKTLIQFSDEAIRIQAENIAMVGAVTFLDVWRDQTGQVTGGVHPSLTRIRGGVIQTGVITSNNWGAGAGSAYDLDNGTITLGGSTAPKFSFDGTNLTVLGSITAGSVIAGSVTVTGVAGTLADIGTAAMGALTTASLNATLAAGVGNVLLGFGSDYVMKTMPTYVAMMHKDAVPFTNIAAYAGNIRSAVALSATGLAMGYHTNAGVWTNAIVLNATTGAATFSGAIAATSGTFIGTLSAGSIITNSVTVDGVSMNTILANAAAGKALKDALEVTGNTVLKGTIEPRDTGAIKIGALTWNTSTGAITGGAGSSGIAITEYGLIGAKNGVLTFSISATTGDAVFSGTLNAATGTFSGDISASTGTFAGNLVTAGQAVFSGSYNNGLGLASVQVNPPTTTTGIIVNKGANAGTGIFTTANIGTALSAQTNSGVAVGGFGNASGGIAGYFLGASGGTGVYAYAPAGGTALSVNGVMTMTNTTVVTNLNADTVDGYHASAFVIAANPVSLGSTLVVAGVATFNGTVNHNGALNVTNYTTILNNPSGYDLQLAGKMYKARANGHTLNVYDTTSHALVGSYEYEFY